MCAVPLKIPTELPHFVAPMLARPGVPFDDDDYLFEVKWDGCRAVCFVEKDGAVRLMNRRRRDVASRYPELVAVLKTMPAGTVLDGEIIVAGPSGKPDFQKCQQREQARNRLGIGQLARSMPATYVVFDQMYSMYKTYLHSRLDFRRDRARATAQRCESPQVVFSEGIVGQGVSYYEAVVAQGLEGVVAKRLASYYSPGKRTDAWLKIKRCEDVTCAVLGFIPEGEHDFASLVIGATDGSGTMRCVGRVGSGFDGDARAAVNGFLWSHRVERPVVTCEYRRALWVEPALYCLVRCMERTNDGKLRAPVFRGLIDAD